MGIHEPAQNGQKVKNTLVWIDEEGKVTQRYQKIHLFDVDIEGGPVLRESNSVEKGERILPPFETGVGRVGMTICFDVCEALSCLTAPTLSQYREQRYRRCEELVLIHFLASVSRNIARPRSPKGSDYRLPICFHHPYWQGALVDATPCSCYRVAVLCRRGCASWRT